MPNPQRRGPLLLTLTPAAAPRSVLRRELARACARRGPRRRRLSPAERAERERTQAELIRRMRAEGTPIRLVAAALKISEATVKRRLAERRFEAEAGRPGETDR